jgi:hypothetical protein
MTTDDTVKTDVVSSLQILPHIDVEKKSKQVRTDENVLAVEDATAKLGNMTLRGKVVFCGYRSS